VHVRDSKGLSDKLAEARKRIAELEADLARLEQRDPLTRSLLSLTAFRAQLDLDVGRANRYGRPLTVALIDIDGFRQLNLERGYGAGDAVLVAVANLIADWTRVHDLACRVGWDEFALLLPETGALGAKRAMERLLPELEDVEARSCAESRSRSASRPWSDHRGRRPCWRPRAPHWSRRAREAGDGR
jgi:diguanylate cyclase (GGDEF)-like protein